MIMDAPAAAALSHGSYCHKAKIPVPCGYNAVIPGKLELHSRSIPALRHSFVSCPSRIIKRESCVSKIRCSTVDEQVILKAGTMKQTYDLLSERVYSVAQTKPNKYLIGIAGPPGAGKSTLTKEVATRINKLWQEEKVKESSAVPEIAIAVPMDGFHLYRHQLDAMEDPVEAHARRGAPWTFNPSALYECLCKLRDQQWGYFPSFDHGVGDPVEQDILVTREHKIVLVEGNYLLLDEGDWEKLAGLFDERWFITVDLETAMRRVEKRHVSTGKSKEYAKQRVDYNDRPNAELILGTKSRADLVINSIDHTS